MKCPLSGVPSAHAESILLTFDICWILIFLLERLGGQAASGLPQFIYVDSPVLLIRQ